MLAPGRVVAANELSGRRVEEHDRDVMADLPDRGDALQETAVIAAGDEGKLVDPRGLGQ